MFEKPKRPVKRIFIHCSASDNPGHDDISIMKKWHLDRGWSDVGYHYFIKKDGTLQHGRPLSRIPAAQAGHNTATIAICLHGLKKEKFTQDQFNTLNNLADEFDKVYGSSITYHGHKEVAAKSCPVFNYKQVLGLDSKGNRQKDSIVMDSEEENIYPRLGERILSLTSEGDDVKWIQESLGLVDDGIFGHETRLSVESFQRDMGITADGIVGPNTWDKLFEVFHPFD